MRYYDILITEQNSGKQIARFATTPQNTGLNIELVAPIVGFGQPVGDVTLKIYNPPLSIFGQTANFNDTANPMRIRIKGGMNKGLPLANQAQQGVLVDGNILFSTGLREGSELSILFIIVLGKETSNLLFSCKKGQPFGQAIFDSLVASGWDRNKINLLVATKVTPPYAPPLLASNDINNTSLTLKQFADNIANLTKGKIIVYFNPATDSIIITDFSTPPDVFKQISPYDLIGQPAWKGGSNGQGIVVLQVVLRGDLIVGSYVQLAQPVLAQISGKAGVGLSDRDRMSFSGIFSIIAITHRAYYAQPDGASWVSVLELLTL